MVPRTTAGRKKAPSTEPKIKWKKSEARRLLHKAIRDGEVPLEAKDDEGQSTMPLKDIYMMNPEHALCSYDKFSSRLSGLRKTIRAANNRAEDDEKAFQNYKQNHPPSEFAHNGCIQWQGSEARALFLEDWEDGQLERLGKMELWGSRAECYENFPLKLFRDKIYQEIRTAKYIYTCEVKGKLHKAS
jgi:hypothetical protein